MESDKKFTCDYCNFSTNTSYSWLRHCESAKHKRQGAKKTHFCKDCDYETTSNWNIKAHILSQHATKEERAKQKYYCPDCDRVFFAPLYYNNHMKGVKHATFVKAMEELKKIKKDN